MAADINFEFPEGFPNIIEQPIEPQVVETKPQIVYSATEVQTAFMLMALAYMKVWRTYAVNEREMERNRMLKELGFTSSKSLQDSEEAIAPSLRKKVFDWYSERFPGCIFLKVEDFVNLLHKYNLVCGKLEAYKGEIPYENLEKIITVKETLKKYENENPYSNKYTDENTISRVEIWGGYKTNKFLYSKGEWEGGHDITKDEYDNMIDNMKRYPFYGSNLLEIPDTELLIAAPAQDMKSQISDFHTKSEDPFVFQLFPYGIVIFSMWGEEAEDGIFMKKWQE